MGIKRVVEVLQYAPKDLTAAERMVLIAIGENVRDGDRERLTWPDFNVNTLAERTGLNGSGSLKSALQRLGKRGLEVRVPITSGKDGRPVYALPGKQCRYRFPLLQGEGTASPNPEEGEGTASPKGRTQPRQAGPQPPLNADKGRTGPPPSPKSTPPPCKQDDEPAPPPDPDDEKQQREEDAIHFLENLPEPWTVGPRTAAVMAKDLAAVIERQGWALDDELTDRLTDKPEGVRNPPQILRLRIADLPKRIRKPKARPQAPLPPWCGDCADGAKAAALEGSLRLVFDDAGNARPCPKCHPSQTAHAA